MSIRGLGRIQQVAWRLRNRFTSRVLILLYHRVRALSFSDPYVIGVTPQHFAEHLEILQKYGHPMPLQRLVRALQDGTLPRRAVVVTFDDGYADNLYNARPLQERYDIPATVFVTAGHVGQGREFWWDELERLLLQPGTLPETLRLTIDGSACQWELGAAAHYGEEDSHRHRYWHYGKEDEPSPRHRLFRSLYQKLRLLPAGEQQHVLEALRTSTGVESAARPTHRTLAPDEVVRLAEGGLIEVGAHTVTHPVLASLPVAAQRDEIHRSKAQLEDIMGRAVSSFAYPYGAQSDYTPAATAIVQEAGFSVACSSFVGTVDRDTDCFQLPRVQVRDWDGDEFTRRLWMFLRG